MLVNGLKAPMNDTQFDPGGFFQFDLAHGRVRTRGGARVLVLAENVLAPLIVTAVQSGDLTAIRQLGSQLGSIVAQSLPAPATSLPPQVVISHAGGVMSLYGWGRLKLEQWGGALVLVVEGLPPLDEDNLAVAALLGGIFSTLCSAEVACVPMARTTKYIMVDPRIAEQVWTWSKSGDNLATIASKLSSPEAS
jgi:membrane protein YqaA with SNARE-associated domain